MQPIPVGIFGVIHSYRDIGLPMTMNILGNLKTVTPYPNVAFTDGVMSNINGSLRKTYCKGHYNTYAQIEIT